MALLSKKEFAEVCGIATKNLSVYITRKKVIVNSHDMIDANDEVNRVFMESKRAKVEEKSLPAAIKGTQMLIPKPELDGIPETTDINDIISLPGQTYTESERQLKYFDTIKRREEISKLKLDNAKKRGEVIPSELINPIFLQHNQSILTEMNNFSDEIVRRIAKRKDLSVNEVAEIKGEFVTCINEAINKAILISANSVDSIVLAYSEKKGIGQRN